MITAIRMIYQSDTNGRFFNQIDIIFINAQDSLANLTGQNVITWGCITDGKDTAHKNQSSTYTCVYQLFASCIVRRRFEPIKVAKIDITRLTHVHVCWKYFVCPQNVNLPISIWLYSTKITICYILKTKLIQAFKLGPYHRDEILKKLQGMKFVRHGRWTHVKHKVCTNTCLARAQCEVHTS